METPRNSIQAVAQVMELLELVQSWCKTKAAPVSELIEPGCLPRPKWLK